MLWYATAHPYVNRKTPPGLMRVRQRFLAQSKKAVILSVAKNLAVPAGADAPCAEILHPRKRGFRMTAYGTCQKILAHPLMPVTCASQ